MIEIDITDDQRKRAKELYEFNELNNSVTRGKGNVVGSLGEIIVMDYFSKVSEYAGKYDYDLIIKGKKVDVKTNKQNIPPAAHHSHNIFAFNTTQKCDWYCFVVILSTLEKGWIVGWKEKDKFFEEANFKKKGEVDDSYKTEWTFKHDCYTMNITNLIGYN